MEASRLELVERNEPELSLSLQAKLLGVSCSGLYYQPVAPSAEQIALKHRIDAIYTFYPFHGSRRITEQLRREEWQINRKAVQHHMREMGPEVIYPGPNLSKRRQQDQIYPYLLRSLTIARSNQVWGIDITYVRLQQGWMDLVAILDWYARYVVSWE